MTRLKLSEIEADRPVKLTLEIPLWLHRQLVTYGVILNDGVKEGAPAPEKLIPPMVEKFIAGDRAFATAKRELAVRDE